MKKILVPVKRVPDYEIKIKVKPDGTGIQTDGIKWIVNPFDEIAVEEAVKIKEGGAEAEIIIVSIGPAETTEQIRTGLAMGADRGILIETTDVIDSDAAYRILLEIVKKESADLIIMGKQAIDSDANQTGQLLAGALEWPQATFASKLELADDWSSASVTREVDGGLENIKVNLPAVVTTDLRLNEPRYPSLPGIVKAKKKQLDQIPLAELGVNSEPKVKVVKVQAPSERAGGIKVDSVDVLVDKLQNEAKVL